jgi:hypothetical protein
MKVNKYLFSYNSIICRIIYKQLPFVKINEYNLIKILIENSGW